MPMDPTYGQDCLLEQTQLTRELWAVQHKLTPEQGGLGPGAHLANAANLLFPQAAFQQNRWSDHRARTIMEQEFTVWWGPGASAKTTDAARAALTYWCAAPHETSVIVCSTTAAMLDKRVWGEIKRLHSAMLAPVGALRKSDREIVFGEATDAGENSKNIIKGVAVLQGTLEEALGNIIGLHNKRVMLVVDEAQASREALVEARVNLRKGCSDFRILLIGNPTSRTDPLGRYSEPTQGWDWFYSTLVRKPYTYFSASKKKQITVNVPFPTVTNWETKYGKVYLYHGFDSPTLDSPAEEERLSFLIKRGEIEADLDEYGAEHARLYTYGLGILPPEGTENKPFTEILFTVAKSSDRVTWRYQPALLASCDPSFSAGGDRFMFRQIKCGIDMEGKVRIEFQNPDHVKPEPMPGEPLEDFQYRAVALRLKQAGIAIEDFAIDVSGSQHSMLSGIERAYGRRGGLGVNSRAKPTSLLLAVDEKRPANDIVANMRTEMWLLMRNFLRFGHLAGVNAEAIREFCAAAFKDNPSKQQDKIQLVDKKDIKAALGKSPDDADTLALGCLLVRHRLGIIPGSHKHTPQLFRNFPLASAKPIVKPVFRVPVRYGVTPLSR
jgi:hypothetical protein